MRKRTQRELLALVQPPPDSQRYATKDMRIAALERAHYRCFYCHTPITDATANIDHKTPWKRGGKTKLVNLVASCKPCNKAKGNLSLNRFLALRKRQQPPQHILDIRALQGL